MNLFDDIKIPFEINKEYAAIIISAGEGQSEKNGKNYISHQLFGSDGETFTKKFYIDTPGGRGFYGRFLLCAGIKKEDLKNWDDPNKALGKVLMVIFKDDSYTPEVWSDELNKLVPGDTIHKVDIKSMKACTDQDKIAYLQELYEAKKADEENYSPF